MFIEKNYEWFLICKSASTDCLKLSYKKEIVNLKKKNWEFILLTVFLKKDLIYSTEKSSM